jgi:dCTP diphosphatase
MSIENLQQQIRDFAIERDWEQFHTPRSLVMAMQSELGELAEIMQWIPDTEITEKWMLENRIRLAEEIADVYIYLLRLADVTSIDLETAVNTKIALNAEKYPVHLSKGNAKKYTEF